MEIFCFKRIISSITIFLAIGCAASPINQPSAPAITKSKTFYGPENQYYYFISAQVQRKKGNLDKAVVLLRKAIELDPDSFYLQRELATVYLQNKEDDNAIVYWRICFKKIPTT